MKQELEHIYSLLATKRIKEALIQMQAISTQTNIWNLQNRITNVLTDYGYMLQYVEQGMEDPTRRKFYNDTALLAHELTDELCIALSVKESTELYHETIRKWTKKAGHTYAEIQMSLETFTEDMSTASLLYNKEKCEDETNRLMMAHEEILNELFERTWASSHWSNTEATQANGILQSLLIHPNDIALMVSAVTLAQLNLFDNRKFNFLFDACLHQDEQVRQRAIIGIMFNCLLNQRRIFLYPQITERIRLLTERPDFFRDMINAQMLFIIAGETENIDKRMKEEILPEMIKRMPKMKSPSEDIDDMESMNPEWDDDMESSGLDNAIKQMSEWQMEGADVFMSTFSQLKKYPFFDRIANWFRPFDIKHPELKGLEKFIQGTSPLGFFINSTNFCNSDKYSFALSIRTMPENMKDMTLQELKQQMEDKDAEIERIRNSSNEAPKPYDVARQYMQDLYRFCKLWKRRAEMTDIFRQNPGIFFSNEMMAIALKDMENAKQMADFMLKKGRWTEAADLYDRIIYRYPLYADLYQKRGLSLEKQNRFFDALKEYKHADMLQPDNLWTQKRMAVCYKKTSNYYKALECYQSVEKIEPDNLNIGLQIALCLIKLKKHDEALKYLYKVEYLSESSQKTKRPIAWCLFCTGKYDEALKHFLAILQSDAPLAEDWINAGHTYLAMRKIKEATEHYRKAHDSMDSHASFIQIFDRDLAELDRLGFSYEETRILLDQLI